VSNLGFAEQWGSTRRGAGKIPMWAKYFDAWEESVAAGRAPHPAYIAGDWFKTNLLSADSSVFNTEEGDIDQWERAWRALRDQCQGLADSGDGSGSSASGDDTSEDNPCECDDDSSPIPCDNQLHERTYGLVVPQWQDLDAERMREVWAALDAEERLGPKGLGDQQWIREYTFPESFAPMNYREFSAGMWPTREAINRPRYFARGYVAQDVGIVSTKVTVKSGDWPAPYQFPDTAEGRAMRASKIKKTLRSAIQQSSGGLKKKIEKWISQIPCEQPPSPIVRCDPWPQVSGEPESDGGSGQPDAEAREGGTNNWYISHFAELNPGAPMVPGVACVRAKFYCVPYLTVVNPQVSSDGSDHVYAPVEHAGGSQLVLQAAPTATTLTARFMSRGTVSPFSWARDDRIAAGGSGPAGMDSLQRMAGVAPLLHGHHSGRSAVYSDELSSLVPNESSAGSRDRQGGPIVVREARLR